MIDGLVAKFGRLDMAANNADISNEAGSRFNRTARVIGNIQRS